MPNPFKPAGSLPLYPSSTLSPPEEYENVASDPSKLTALSQTAEMARRTSTQKKAKWVSTVSSSQSTSSSPQTQATTSVTSFSITSNVYLSPSNLNPAAPSFQPSLCGTQPQSETTNKTAHQAATPETTSITTPLYPLVTSTLTLPPVTPIVRLPPPPQYRMLGWPPSQTPLAKREYNTQHPAFIPDTIFLTDHAAGTSWRYLRDVYENGVFNPTNTPWWTHWFITFAHVYTRTHPATDHEHEGEGENEGESEEQGHKGWTQQEICDAYKRRYGDNVPGLERMTVDDEDALFVWLVREKLDYAFEWEGARAHELRGEVERCVAAAYAGASSSST